MKSPEIDILRDLLDAGETFVSGSRLAQRLGVSRVAVWSQMEKLRAAGFKFEARPRLGYRIAGEPVELSPVFLRALLPAAWSEVPIHFFETIDSTNSEAERLLATSAAAPFVVIARTQESGRGRLGRSWVSADKGNIYLTFAFQPRLPPRRMQTFTLWMGVALCDFLNRGKDIPARLKWPNDLLLNGKKIGGMLTEARVDNDRIRDLVFGLGLNVNGRRKNLAGDLKPVATSIAIETKRPVSINRFTADLLARVLEAYRDFTNGAFEKSLGDLWNRYDALAGKSVSARQGNERLEGVARGIDDDGCLLLEQSDGARLRLSAGDVSLSSSA